MIKDTLLVIIMIVGLGLAALTFHKIDSAPEACDKTYLETDFKVLKELLKECE